MRVTKLNSNQLSLVNVKDYLINWQKAPSKGQQKLQDFLYSYLKSKLILSELRIPGSLLRWDIVDVNSKRIYEFDGGQHDNYNAHFHRNNRLNYLKQIKSDIKKEEWAAKNGFQVIRIYETDLPLLSREFFKEKFGVDL